MNAAPPAIDIRSLRVDYGDFVAVNDLSLSVPAGEVFGLVGPNGAGKTSTFRVLATLMEPTYGEVLLDGIDIADDIENARRTMPNNSADAMRLPRTSKRSDSSYLPNGIRLMIFE